MSSFLQRYENPRVASLLAVVLAMTLALSACSGGDDEGADASTSQEASIEDDRATELTEKLVAALGSEEAFNGVIYAWERGYSHAQLFAAIEGRRLQADGNIQDADGDIDQPEGSRLGLVILPDTASGSASGFKLLAWSTDPPLARAAAAPIQEPNLTVEEIRAGAARLFGENPDPEDMGLALMPGLLALALAGYSPEQITEQLILGGNANFELYESVQVPGTSRSEFSCMVLRDAGGTVLAPALQPAEDVGCFTLIQRLANDPSGASITGGGPASQDDESDVNPENAGSYGGEMTMVQCRADCSATCTVTGTMQLSISEDGVIFGGLPAHARWDGSGCREPLQPGWVVEGFWSPDGSVTVSIVSDFDAPAVATGNLEDGTLTLELDDDPLAGDPGSIAAFDAVLTKD